MLGRTWTSDSVCCFASDETKIAENYSKSQKNKLNPWHSLFIIWKGCLGTWSECVSWNMSLRCDSFWAAALFLAGPHPLWFTRKMLYQEKISNAAQEHLIHLSLRDWFYAPTSLHMSATPVKCLTISTDVSWAPPTGWLQNNHSLSSYVEPA